MFYNCTSLKTINWGANIKTIGNIAFLNCSALTDITLPANITDIGNHAFFGCSSLNTVVVSGNVNYIGRYAFGNCPALHYVDFRGATMTSDPGYKPFAFDKGKLTVYAAEGSTGWTGVAEVAGLPTDGMWCGAAISYGPPPASVSNPYDFYLYTRTDRVNYKDYVWSAPILVTTNRYVTGRTIPTQPLEIYDDETLYLSYCFDEYWRGSAFVVTNVFTLSGTKDGSFDLVGIGSAHAQFDHWWATNAVPAVLQGLPVGDYTLSMNLNGDGRLAETDLANNTTSIVFKVVAAPKYTVTFDANGGTVGEASRKVVRNTKIGTLPTPKCTGYDFQGWYTRKSGGEVLSADSIVSASTTVYAHWTVSKFTVKFNPAGGTVSETSRVREYNCKVGALPTPTRANYTFQGWYTAAVGGTKVSSSTLVLSNVTYYAQWVGKSYTITVYPNGSGATLSGAIFGASDGQSKTAKVSFGLKTDLNNTVGIAKRSGYVFLGWYTQRDAGGLVFDANGKCRKGGAFWNSNGCWIKESNVSLYAHWSKAPSAAVAPIIPQPVVSSPVVDNSVVVDGVAYLPDGESFPVEARIDADGFAVVELEDAIFCGYVADGVGELFSGDRTLYLLVSP